MIGERSPRSEKKVANGEKKVNCMGRQWRYKELKGKRTRENIGASERNEKREPRDDRRKNRVRVSEKQTGATQQEFLILIYVYVRIYIQSTVYTGHATCGATNSQLDNRGCQLVVAAAHAAPVTRVQLDSGQHRC